MPTQIVQLTALIDNAGTVTGSFDNFGLTLESDDTSPGLVGTLSAGLGTNEVINVYRDEVFIGIATVVGLDWSFNDSGLSNGSTYSYTAQVFNTVDTTTPYGGLSAELLVHVDTTASSAVAVIVSYDDDIGSIISDHSTAATTDDDAPTLQRH